MCCEHGNGSYEVKFDGNVVKSGGAFYEEERTEFGRCGETATPTVSPIVEVVSDPSGESGGGASIGGSSYLCVASPLVQSGYEVAKNKCDKFTNCYNQFIEDGDDWFCGENEKCVAAPACAGGGGGAAIGGVSTSERRMSFRCVAKPLAEKGYEVSKNKCDLFDDCYNEDTGDGDDFFCDEIAQCVEAPACDKFSASDTKAPSSSEINESPGTVAPTIMLPQPPSETAIESLQPSGNESPIAGPPPTTPGKEPSVTKPSGATKPVPAVDTTEVTASTDLPTASPMRNNTDAPTFNPTTFSPTYVCKMNCTHFINTNRLLTQFFHAVMFFRAPAVLLHVFKVTIVAGKFFFRMVMFLGLILHFFLTSNRDQIFQYVKSVWLLWSR